MWSDKKAQVIFSFLLSFLLFLTFLLSYMWLFFSFSYCFICKEGEYISGYFMLQVFFLRDDDVVQLLFYKEKQSQPYKEEEFMI